jgi:hypothetical protein
MSLLQKKAKSLLELIKENDHILRQLLFLIFSLLGLIGILNHAMWRDELNGWLLTRDSHTFSELFANVKYEGHPLLWYLLLDLLNRFTHNAIAMQFLHWLIAIISAYLFIKYSPFTNLQKGLFVFGYLPFYEYLVMSRNYSIGLFCVFLFCILFEKRKKSYLLLASILALMANTNAYCLLIAIALSFILAIEYFSREKLTYKLKASKLNIIFSSIIFLLGITISIVTLMPPLDSNLQGGATQWMLQLDLFHLCKAITRVWNSYILILLPAESRFLDVFIFALISLFILIFIATSLLKKPFVLFFYLLSSLEILAFTYIKFLGSARHYGHLYLILIISLWLTSYYPSSDWLSNSFAKISGRIGDAIAAWINFCDRYKTTLIMVILYAQLVAGIISFGRDLLIPYSASRETANFIKSQHLEQMFIVGSEDFAISPIGAYLNQQLYYPESQQMGSFVLFNSKRQPLNASGVLEQVSQLIQEKEQEILLILNYELTTSRDDLTITSLKQFTNAFIHNEKYYLYKVFLKI